MWQAITRHSASGSPTYTDYRYTLRLADGRSRAFRGALPARAARASGAVRLEPTPGITTPVTIEQLGRLLETGVTRISSCRRPWIASTPGRRSRSGR